MAAPILSVIVPECDSPEQTKITLRLLRKYSDPGTVKVFAVGTDKNSPSFSYASKLKWIGFADFSSSDPRDPAALRNLWNDFFGRIESPFVLVMTSGIACLRADWADYLTGHFDTDRFFAFKCCSLPVRRSLKERFFSGIKSVFKREQELPCSCLVCRREHLGCCLDLSAARPRFSDVIFKESVSTLPPRETTRFFCRIGQVSDGESVKRQPPAFFRDILDAGELDL